MLFVLLQTSLKRQLMKRGEIWTLQDVSYVSKARPVLVIQSNTYANFDSVILCLFTTYNSQIIPTRVLIEPTKANGLIQPSYVMTDKIVTVDKTMFGKHIGFLDTKQLNKVSEQIGRILALG